MCENCRASAAHSLLAKRNSTFSTPILQLTNTVADSTQDKYTNDYPGDVEETFPLAERIFRQPLMRIRWVCHSCSTTFIDHQKKCRKCTHERCKYCTRDPPEKVRPPPDPSTLHSLEDQAGLRGGEGERRSSWVFLSLHGEDYDIQI
jgi:hypothetical protein